MKLKLGFSTCPNDTYMFDAMVHGHIDTRDISYEVVLADIFHLNQMALKGELDVVKVSYFTYSQLTEKYHLLDAGSALGHNCGPLLISKEPLHVEQIIQNNLPVAIPGHNTTANLLLNFFAPGIRNRKPYIFHEIMPAILNGEAAAGVIIHENRFTYQDQGLLLIQDLGEYWEQETGLPIPLGGIVAHKRLGENVIAQVEQHMHDSVAYAFSHPEVSMPFVKEHAQEMDERVMKAHIQLYVNDYSLSLGEKGRNAVKQVLATSARMNK